MRSLMFAAIWLVATLGLVQAKEPRVLEPREQDGEVGIRTCKNEKDDPNNPGLAGPYEIKICYDAFVVNFPERPQAGEPLRVPRFVVHRVFRLPEEPKTEKRYKGAWFTVPELEEEGLAATDASYLFGGGSRPKNADWYERGHLAANTLADRAGSRAAKFTHTTANAVPQLGQFNRFGWLDLECRTGAWAAAADVEALWVVTGPVFTTSRPRNWLRAPANDSAAGGRNSARAPVVAIPDKLFKIVVRRDRTGYQALAFLYPQEDPRYKPPLKQIHAEDFLETVSHIEKLTGLKFFEALGDKAPDKNAFGRPANPGTLWPQKAANFERGCRNFAKDQP